MRAQPPKHRGEGFASNLVEVLKSLDLGLLMIDAPPCLSDKSVIFWLQHKFNPSDELLRMKSLANGKKHAVRIVQNAKLTWESDSAWDKEKYKQMMTKHFPHKKMIGMIDEAAAVDESPRTAYATRKRMREM